MVVRLIWFLRGYVTLILSGQFVERFINICMRRGIYLWNVQRCGSTTRLCMSIRAFKTVAPIAKKTHTRIKISEKHGLPVRLAAYRRRTLFSVGLLLAVTFLYASSLFLWSVEVEGTERTNPQEILDVLSDLGVRPGAYKRRIAVRDVKENALLRLDDLSWLWVDIRGCRARVQVMEKTPAPALVPTNACDIIAASDGVISEVIATEGQAKVAPGDTVLKGQVLISSVFTSTRENIPARYTHAAGQVFARTWYEESITLPLHETEKVYTQNTHTDHALRLGNLTLPLSRGGAPFQKCDKTHTAHDWVIFGVYTGISYHTDTYAEYTESTIPRTKAATIAAAEKMLDAKIEAARFDKDGVRTDASTACTENSDGTVTVTRICEYKEQIGVEQAVDALY